MDTLANLRAFLAVARTGSFAAAARELDVARSVVTKRVAQIEWRMQARLFERTSRVVALTSVGLQCLPAVKRVVADLEGLFAASRDAATELRGSIRLKVPTTLGGLFLGPILRSFQRAHPHVSLDLVALDRAVNPVEEGFDVCLTLRPYSFDGTIEEPLCPMPQHLVASQEYLLRHGEPVHPGDLAAHQLLNFTPSGNRWEFAGPAGPVFVDVHPRLASNDAQLLLAAAVEGDGIAWLSDYVCRDHIASGHLRRLLPEYVTSDLWLKAQVPEGRWHVERVRTLVDWLKTHLVAPGSTGTVVPAATEQTS
jgi:DNA-binding transcriptional LysR family regulator